MTRSHHGKVRSALFRSVKLISAMCAVRNIRRAGKLESVL